MVNVAWEMVHRLGPAKGSDVEGEEIALNGELITGSGRLLATYERGAKSCDLRAVVGNSRTYVTLKVMLRPHAGCGATIMTLLCAYMDACGADLCGMMQRVDHDVHSFSEFLDWSLGDRGRYWLVATFKWRSKNEG